MKLAISALLVCMLAMVLVSYKTPGILTIGIVFQILVFGKYMYDRRVKLKNELSILSSKNETIL